MQSGSRKIGLSLAAGLDVEAVVELCRIDRLSAKSRWGNGHMPAWSAAAIARAVRRNCVTRPDGSSVARTACTMMLFCMRWRRRKIAPTLGIVLRVAGTNAIPMPAWTIINAVWMCSTSDWLEHQSQVDQAALQGMKLIRSQHLDQINPHRWPARPVCR
jgi:hypothetical protein